MMSDVVNEELLPLDRSPEPRSTACSTMQNLDCRWNVHVGCDWNMQEKCVWNMQEKCMEYARKVYEIFKKGVLKMQVK